MQNEEDSLECLRGLRGRLVTERRERGAFTELSWFGIKTVLPQNRLFTDTFFTRTSESADFQFFAHSRLSEAVVFEQNHLSGPPRAAST